MGFSYHQEKPKQMLIRNNLSRTVVLRDDISFLMPLFVLIHYQSTLPAGHILILTWKYQPMIIQVIVIPRKEVSNENVMNMFCLWTTARQGEINQSFHLDVLN